MSRGSQPGFAPTASAGHGRSASGDLAAFVLDDDVGPGIDDPHVIPVGDPTYPEGFNYSQFISEVELERLNMARAPENVLVQHMIELEGLLTTTDQGLVTLDPAGRITFDGVAIDAMPKSLQVA